MGRLRKFDIELRSARDGHSLDACRRRSSGRSRVAGHVASSAGAVIGEGWGLRQQCGGLLTVAVSSSWTAASRIGELTLATLSRHWGGAQPTSAMWRIADGSGVEHPGGCFLYQRYSHSRPGTAVDSSTLIGRVRRAQLNLRR